MIKHAPRFDVNVIEKHYSEKDGVPVRYVCSTDLGTSDMPVDVFYRSTPHPEFGNHYFGIYLNREKQLMITSADVVEDYEFGMIEDKDGNYWYSQSHHDCLFIDGKMIDGGREYIRHTGECEIWKVKDGEMVRTVFINET